MSLEPQELLRRIPKMDRFLEDPEVAALAGRYGRSLVADAARAAVETLRLRILQNGHPDDGPEDGLEDGAEDGTVPRNGDLLPALRREVAEQVRRAGTRTLRPAINATGVVLHTGLGRAVLAASAADAVSEAARSHSLLEVDPESGERGSRLDHAAGLLRELTGAEDALVVNNCAAAVFLAVGALAAGREVVIARGQLVEIGGSFRIPDVICASGARLVEVGTTNKVRIRDYAEALTPETALILRVHPSNFRIVGFTEEPALEALCALGRERGVPVLDDLGSGALIDLTRYGLVAEPTVHASVAAGAEVVTFSGDKLLGGPQAGIVLGKSGSIARMKRHPLMRILRVDKLTMAALEATLRLYREEAAVIAEVPTLAALTAAPERLRARAERLAALLRPLPLQVELEAGISQVGGGSLPGEELPTTLVALQPRAGSVTELSRRLRTGTPSVWGRIRRERLLLDPRTVRDEELEELAGAMERALRACGEIRGQHDPAN